MKEYITMKLEKDKAEILLNYFSVQDMEDVINILMKHRMKGIPIHYELALQHLLEEIFNGLEDEY